MATYKVLATSYINNKIVEAGQEVEFEGKVREDYDQHLELVDTGASKKKQAAEQKAVDDATRAEAIKLKLTEDGKAGGKPIDGETPIDVVELCMAEYKSANVFK